MCLKWQGCSGAWAGTGAREPWQRNKSHTESSFPPSEPLDSKDPGLIGAHEPLRALRTGGTVGRAAVLSPHVPAGCVSTRLCNSESRISVHFSCWVGSLLCRTLIMTGPGEWDLKLLSNKSDLVCIERPTVMLARVSELFGVYQRRAGEMAQQLPGIFQRTQVQFSAPT